MPAKIKRTLLLIAGTLFTATGIIGIIVPVLPTTPFLLLAAACYIRSSQKFYNWLINNRILGTYINNYVQGKGMPLKVKLLTLSLLWITVSLSSVLFVQSVLIRVFLILAAAGVSIHIIRIKTLRGINH
ncbi:YbaN family protein [Chloroflexota bacterium]